MRGVTETEGKIEDREREREVDILRRRETQDEPLFICSSCVCVCVCSTLQYKSRCLPYSTRLQATVALFGWAISTSKCVALFKGEVPQGSS